MGRNAFALRSFKEPKICFAMFNMGAILRLMRRSSQGAGRTVESFELVGFFVSHRRAPACENTLDSCAGET
jgi:hypothetical protein